MTSAGLPVPPGLTISIPCCEEYNKLGRKLSEATKSQALQALATGLANDRNALFRERLIEKQQHILAQISARFQSEQEWLARRAARLR